MGINFKKIAKAIASASKDPRYKVGAVIFDQYGIIRSTGYNGIPRNVADTSARYEKPLKQFYVVHAEANAIVQAARSGTSTDDCSIYIYGKAPCAGCAALIIQAGIRHVYFQPEDYANSAYSDSFNSAFAMFSEAGITLHEVLK